MSEQMNEELNAKAPSKEEIIAFLQEQIEVKSKQFELQELNTKLAVARAEELKALQFIAQLTNPNQQAPQGTPHKVTQEDLDNHPELVEAGLKVGDDVLIAEETPASEETTKQRSLKKK
jgi:hypothetical protein